MTTLITGATGFLGSAVARRLLEAGHTVRALVRPNSDRRNLHGLDVELAEGDLTDAPSLERAVQGCSALFHVAADYRLWIPDPDVAYRVNVDGTRALMLAAMAAGVERIVYTSSVATLGLNADGTPADEHTPVSIDDMMGHYKRSKFLAEEAVMALVREQDLPAVVVNPSAPVGPRDIKPTPTGRMIRDAASGRMPAFVDTGLNVVHVDDVAAGHLAAFEHGRVGERYILGGENMTLREILTAVSELCGRPAPRLRLPHGFVLPIAYVAEGWATVTKREPAVTVAGARLARKHMFFTCDRARRELAYAPRPAAEALADAVRWFADNGYLK